MGIEAKHAYRFGYLRSEEWQTVRIEALAREKGKCQICGEFSISNDAHHIEYPANIYQTKADNLVIVCRPCHDLTHDILRITGIKSQNKGQFLELAESFQKWRRERHNNEYRRISKMIDPNDGKPDKTKLCRGCGSASDVMRYIFFESVKGPKTFRSYLCIDCIEEVKTMLTKPKPENVKWYEVYEAWKRSRKL